MSRAKCSATPPRISPIRGPILSWTALPLRPKVPQGRHPGGALVAAVRQQGRSPGAGAACGMLFKANRFAPAALRAVLAHRRQGRAGPDEAWITDMYTSALAQANESERAMAHRYLEDWLKTAASENLVASAPHSAEICLATPHCHGPASAACVFLAQCGMRRVEAKNEEAAVRKHGVIGIGFGVGDAGAGPCC